jgi:hypothetical protein
MGFLFLASLIGGIKALFFNFLKDYAIVAECCPVRWATPT